MKKRWLGVALSAVMTVGLLAGCGGKTESTPTGSAGSSSADTSAAGKTENKTASSTGLRLINGKIEIDKQLKEVAELFKKETGQEVTIESLGGGVDIQGQIKSYKAADYSLYLFNFGQLL